MPSLTPARSPLWQGLPGVGPGVGPGFARDSRASWASSKGTRSIAAFAFTHHVE